MLELKKRIHKALVVAAHPDDEILGCGATIKKWASEGIVVHTMILAEGVTSRSPQREADKTLGERSALYSAAQKANALLGVVQTDILDFPDNRLDSVDLLDIIKKIEEKISVFQPDTILTHHSSDLNIDHRITQQAVMTACRPQPGAFIENILFFEIPSATDWQAGSFYAPFKPTLFSNIKNEIQSKLEALKIYESEMRPWPHSRSIQNLEVLAKYRGASVGYEAAEAFEVGRILIP